MSPTSRRYTPAEKVSALEQLQTNGGNVTITALQTGISERTLYHWRRQDWLQQILQRQSPPPLLQQPPAFDDDLDALRFLRTQIMDELVSLAMTLKDGANLTTPYQRVALLSQLLDRLIKLDAHLKPYTPVEHTVRIEYADPDMEEDTVP